MGDYMSFTHKLVFDPVLGEFRFAKVPIVTLGAGGTAITSGVVSLVSGTQMECVIELTVTNSSGLTIENGSTLMVI
jgi:hypothetical protein